MSIWNQRVRNFFSTEAAGGVFLIMASLLALLLANSPARDSYFDLTQQSHTFVNEFLMSIFFFLVGLEIRREFIDGELSNPKKAALPVIAALGGMLFPALIYLTFNSSGSDAKGWAIPMPTDIALALGVLALLGSRIDSSLKIFLLTLAIADDLFSILVLGLFYGNGLEPIKILGTIGAVIVAFLIPIRKRFSISGLIERIHPWSAFLIIPLFAFVNIGISINFSEVYGQLSSPVARGIIIGRVVGKFVGITLFAWIAIKLGIASKPDSISFQEISGVAALAGMGLTVSLFIAELAITQSSTLDEVKLGLLTSAIVAGTFGYFLLRKFAKAQD